MEDGIQTIPVCSVGEKLWRNDDDMFRVWLAALFDCDVTKLAYCPDFLSTERAIQMRKSAMAALKP